MNIINEKIEVLAQVDIGSGKTMKYCHILYKDDAGGHYPLIIIESADSPLNRKIESFFVVEKEFIKHFLKPLLDKLQ